MKFNEKPAVSKEEPNVIAYGKETTNIAGGIAYELPSDYELATAVLTTFLKNSYYELGEERLSRIKNLIEINDPYFVANLAIYARHKVGLRQITYVLAGELAKYDEIGKEFYYEVVRRPDDMCEILAYYLKEYGKPIPTKIRKGFAKAFEKFDDYQLAKYRKDKYKIKLVDVINLCHPKPTERNQVGIRKLIRGELRNTKTWESVLSKDDGVEKNKKWEKLLKDDLLGDLAFIRNIRNIIESDKELIPLVIDRLNKIDNDSNVMPHQFFTAYTSIPKDYNEVRNEISNSCERALPKVEMSGDVAIFLDVSGSMVVNDNNYLIANPLAVSLYKSIPNSDLFIFSIDCVNLYYLFKGLESYESEKKSFILPDYLKTKYPHPREMQLLELSELINDMFLHFGTDIVRPITKLRKKYDKLIFISDMQSWAEEMSFRYEINNYCNKFNCNPIICFIDVAGYGTTELPRIMRLSNGKFIRSITISGRNSEILKTIGDITEDRDVLINRINSSYYYYY